MSNLRSQIINSMKSHARGHIDKHKMNAEIYFSNASGVGGDPDILEAIEKELDIVAKYEDQLEVLNKHFSDEEDSTQIPLFEQ